MTFNNKSASSRQKTSRGGVTVATNEKQRDHDFTVNRVSPLTIVQESMLSQDPKAKIRAEKQKEREN